MSFWRKISPSGAATDFWHEFTRPNPYRWWIMAASAASTFTLFWVMWQEEMKAPPAKPEVTWITTFHPERTDAEIIASNIENQKRKDQLAAEQAAREERVKDIYRTLGRMSGMDVEKIEREAEAERQAQERAEAQGRKAPREQPVAAP